MLDIAKQTIEYFIQNKKIPTKSEIQIKIPQLLEKKGSVFVTLYKNGNIVGSAGNIMEIENDLVNEIISSTIAALKDVGELSQKEDYHIRIDVLLGRNVLQNKTISDINPIEFGCFVIKKDYSKLAVILPNISSNITSGSDIKKALSLKIEESLNEEDYIIYEFKTQVFTSF